MVELASRADEILDVAERMARLGGYNRLNYPKIASELGILPERVHHYYPTQEDLARAVAKRYTERFFEYLGSPADPAFAPLELVERYIAAYRTALVDEGLMCLCGMLGAEVAALPETVALEAKRFFERNVKWLTLVFRRMNDTDQARSRALRTISELEGAMILSRTLGDHSVFDEVATGLSESVRT